jgi:SAM-dependent methyltransferase
VIRVLAATYRRIVPEPLRKAIRRGLAAPGYSRAFFSGLDAMQQASYEVMARTIVERFRPRSVVDVGCGSSGLLAALRRSGVPRLLGLESGPEGVKLGARKGIEVRETDLSKPFTLDPSFELAVCLEVAEHLPAEVADAFVAGLTSGPGLLLFSAATPGQGGHNHINEQPHEYWIEKLAGVNFFVDQEVTQSIRAEWTAADVARWYCRNVMVLKRRITPDRHPDGD